METKDDLYYINKIINDLQFIVDHTKGLTIEDMMNNELLVDSIMFRIIQISENNNHLSNAFRTNNSKIPWASIRGMRNKIVHDYGIINYEMVYDTVNNQIPEMLKILLDNINKTA